jgi:hypothetical protein
MGYFFADLTCTVPNDRYGGEMDGDTTKYTCSLPRTNFTGWPAWDIPALLPHTSYTHSCTMNSVNSTALVLKSYGIETDAEMRKTASFTVFNPGPADEYAISDMPVLDDGAWHTCAGIDSLPWQLLSCEYLLDRTTNNIGFRFKWYCDDLDPYDAYVGP